MKRIICLAALFLGILPGAAAKPVIWNLAHLQELKDNPDCSQKKSSIIAKADDFAAMEPVTVVRDGKLFVPDAHYYVSFGRYWWADPNNPDGPYIKRDGVTNPELMENDHRRITELANRLSNWAAAFYFTSDRKYHKAAARQLRAWFIDKETYMFPNLEYGQVVPGRGGNKGRSYGLIDVYCMNDILDALELMDGINTTGKHQIDLNVLEEIVRTDEKQRYSFNEDKTQIRANQGHSIQWM